MTTEAQLTESREVHLTGWHPFDRSVKSTLFGQLVKLAQPLIQHYHGDLYYDVHWIDEHVEGPVSFYFGADESGTALGFDVELVHLSRDNVWKIDLFSKRKDPADGNWYVRITPLFTGES